MISTMFARCTTNYIVLSALNGTIIRFRLGLVGFVFLVWRTIIRFSWVASSVMDRGIRAMRLLIYIRYPGVEWVE
jgi:hypothetical protein